MCASADGFVMRVKSVWSCRSGGSSAIIARVSKISTDETTYIDNDFGLTGFEQKSFWIFPMSDGWWLWTKAESIWYSNSTDLHRLRSPERYKKNHPNPQRSRNFHTWSESLTTNSFAVSFRTDNDAYALSTFVRMRSLFCRREKKGLEMEMILSICIMLQFFSCNFNQFFTPPTLAAANDVVSVQAKTVAEKKSGDCNWVHLHLRDLREFISLRWWRRKHIRAKSSPRAAFSSTRIMRNRSDNYWGCRALQKWFLAKLIEQNRSKSPWDMGFVPLCRQYKVISTTSSPIPFEAN